MLKLAFGDDSAGYLMKINYYRPCPEPDWVMGIKAHTDFNGLTLLIPNEIFGLQVFKEDRWLDVDYIYPAVIIIIGDQIMVSHMSYYRFHFSFLFFQK